jgi:hypothetical protein
MKELLENYLNLGRVDRCRQPLESPSISDNISYMYLSPTCVGARLRAIRRWKVRPSVVHRRAHSLNYSLSSSRPEVHLKSREICSSPGQRDCQKLNPFTKYSTVLPSALGHGTVFDINISSTRHMINRLFGACWPNVMVSCDRRGEKVINSGLLSRGVCMPLNNLC